MPNIKRVFVEKKVGFNSEASNLFSDITDFLQIKNIQKVRMLYRYDIQGISDIEYEQAIENILSDPPQDIVYDENFSYEKDDFVFAVEYLAGQYDQRSDSAAQCIQIITQKERPLIRSAKVIVLSGPLNKDNIASIKKFCINPVDSREAGIKKPNSLDHKITKPKPVKHLK